jgi:anti-sigma factor ChrR (cupin superfamily)
MNATDLAAGLNDDFTQTVIIQTAEMDWQSSPSPSVWRKRLDLAGGLEAGRVTSLVRYDPDSQFPPHPHPDGEEIFVLEGVFSDEFGDYPTGTFILNPEGFRHAPFSKEGCVIFVKLRQYPGPDRKRIIINTNVATWQSSKFNGVEMLSLYREDAYPEDAHLTRFSAGTSVPMHVHSGGEEIFVLDGVFSDEAGDHPTGTWLRYPIGSSHADWTDEGCLIYVKKNHLRDLSG